MPLEKLPDQNQSINGIKIIRCRTCGHERQLTEQWLKEISSKLANDGSLIKESEISRYLYRLCCSNCKEKNCAVIDNPRHNGQNNPDFICLAASRKYGGYCLAGKQWVDGKVGTWLRPVSMHENGELAREEILLDNGSIPQCMDVITIDVQGVREHPYQKENVLVAEKRPWTWQWKLPFAALPDLVDDVSDLWMTGFRVGNDMNDRVSEEELRKTTHPSLYLIKPDDFTILVADDLYARKKIRARFTYRGIPYTLSVTDPAIEKTYLMKLRGEYPLSDQEVYLTISMGEPFNGYCYKLIAAVITME